MRFTSLIVELVRARPKLIVWVAILLQFGLWLAVPMALYSSPPSEVATVLAFGREHLLGTDLGPPLAFWLADLAFRLADDHMFGVYLIAGLSFVLTMSTLFQLSGAVVGRQQAALAVLLTATMTVFSFPGLEFGPAVLARPLWALVLWHAWRVIGQDRRRAWLALSVASGLLLLTTPAAALLLALLLVFMLATARGRRALWAVDPLYALAIAAVIALPYLVWLLRSSPPHWPQLPPLTDLAPRGLRWSVLLGELLLVMSGIAILVFLNSGRGQRKADDAPVIFRPPVEPFARHFVLYFAVAPALTMTLVSAVFGLDEIFGGAGTAVLLAGLVVIVASDDLIPLRRQELLRTVWAVIIVAPAVVLAGVVLIQPWVSMSEVPTGIPARAIGQFFGDSFERRTGQPLRAVAGDPQLAALVALGAPRRPHVLYDGAPARSPWLSPSQFRDSGGVVVWRAADTAGTPPAEIARQFPGLASELPRAFERQVGGRQPLLRLGWGIVRPLAH